MKLAAYLMQGFLFMTLCYQAHLALRDWTVKTYFQDRLVDTMRNLETNPTFASAVSSLMQGRPNISDMQQNAPLFVLLHAQFTGFCAAYLLLNSRSAMLLVIFNSVITIAMYNTFTSKKGPCSVAFSNF